MTPLLVFVWRIAPSMRHTDVVPNIALAIGASADVSREIEEAALIETAKIWAPYGVTISVLAASNHIIVPDVVVVAAPNRRTREMSHALAWVPLAREHTPVLADHVLAPEETIRVDILPLAFGTCALASADAVALPAARVEIG